ncbi:hypothetical protein SEA_TYPHA_122 [Mycobacterium phage Typha]|uniref:Uncharacterized protein n=1 Tax=Mycobacterium phage Typha TaxID=2517971 RepID=A0A482J6Y6_9CAUD|nr:hypothetical protein KCH40_gp047 [Mycobacterium phage Typha]QBP29777.1 hypothetical protein SEA_TYPHA_122 [Mycobacterium phage Typha]URM86563.1 hypothetical protein PBI_HILLTOPFARM_126 [Mycobacterium phage Hilltopfarm]
MAAVVPLVLNVAAHTEVVNGEVVVALVVDGKVIERKPLRDYMCCPTCGTNRSSHTTTTNLERA